MPFFIPMFYMSPLGQFEIHSLMSLDANGYFQLAISNYTLSLVAVILVLIIFKFAGRFDTGGQITPSNFGYFTEAIYSTIVSITTTQIRVRGQAYTPFFYTLFLLILLSNFVGLVTYNRTATAQFAFAIGMSCTIWFGVTLLGLATHKVKYFSYFVPQGSPVAIAYVLAHIEIVSHIAKALSLGLRLSINAQAGHVLIHIISNKLMVGVAPAVLNITTSPITAIVALAIGSLPFVFLVAFMSLEVLICCLQAIVFTMLVSTYVKDALYLH